MVRIRPCRADDDHLARLVEAMNAELVAVYRLPAGARPAPLTPDARYLLAWSGARPVGCCAVQPVDEVTWELKGPARHGTTPAGRRPGLPEGRLPDGSEVAPA